MFQTFSTDCGYEISDEEAYRNRYDWLETDLDERDNYDEDEEDN